MATLKHLYLHTRKYGISRHKTLYMVCLMLLFFELFDGMLTYILPILVTQRGFSESQMGLILGTSSLAGAAFDFILSKFMRNVHYRRLYLFMLGACFVYPAILWLANGAFLFLLGMAIWGLYYDLMQFGNYNFISHETTCEEHASSFGVLEVFKNIGRFIAPLLAAVLVNEFIDFKPFVLAWIFISIAGIFYWLVKAQTDKQKNEIVPCQHFKKINILTEVRLWKKIGWQVLPVLSFTCLLTFFDSFFWTIGPLFALQLKEIHGLGELLLSAYYLPPLLIGWFLAMPARIFGKKKTAFFCFALGSLILSSTALFRFQPLVVVAIFFISSFFVSASWPLIQGTYADYISETTLAENEIEGLADFFTNLGFVAGPAVAGILASLIGNAQAFSMLGVLGFFLSVFIHQVTPKKIDIKVGHLPQ